MSHTFPPRSEAEFELVMQEIDEELRRSGVPIHGRSLNAGLEYSRRFDLEFPLSRSGQKGTPGNYSDSNVDAHIRDWFDRRYGDRQKIDSGPGKTVILLRGDPWQMRLPLIYGTVRCIVDRDLSRYTGDPVISTVDRLGSMNILGLVDGLPQGLAAQLSDAECRHVLNVFREALEGLRAIEAMQSRPLVPEASADVAAAVSQMFTTPPHFGLSKWASCQASEKLIKCFLASCNLSFPKTHDLGLLADLAKGHGLWLEAGSLAHASAMPGVRYGEISVTVEEAVQAHAASLSVGRQVLRAIEGKV